MKKKSKTAYVDSGAFIAFLDRSDSYHLLFARLFSDPPSLVTSSLVISECHGWFLKRYNSRRAIEFLNFIEDLSVISIKEVGVSEINAAASFIKKFSDQALTLADAFGLVVMNQMKIQECWSVDRDLSLTGRTLIIDL